MLKLLSLAETDIHSLTEPNWQTGGIIRLNRSQIRRMIGRWSPHIHSMKINEVIDDIMEKVRNEKEGIYYYYSGQCKGREGKVVPKSQYRLMVKNQRYKFWDITRKIYYTIKKDKREKIYDSNSNSRRF